MIIYYDYPDFRLLRTESGSEGRNGAWERKIKEERPGQRRGKKRREDKGIPAYERRPEHREFARENLAVSSIRSSQEKYAKDGLTSIMMNATSLRPLGVRDHISDDRSNRWLWKRLLKFKDD